MLIPHMIHKNDGDDTTRLILPLTSPFLWSDFSPLAVLVRDIAGVQRAVCIHRGSAANLLKTLSTTHILCFSFFLDLSLLFRKIARYS